MRKRNAWIRRLTLIAIFLVTAGAWAQDYITRVEDSAFEDRMRPIVAFAHDAHNEKAGIADCSTCHHIYENGEKQPGQMSIGMECSDCHLSEQGKPMELIRAYHRMCKTCHLEQSAGPVQCAQCHRRHSDETASPSP